MAKNLISSIRNKPKNTALDPKKLVKMIYAAYEDGRSSNEFKTKKTFSPSTLGYGHGTCARYWTIAFSGAEFTESTPATNIASMSSGTDAHTRIQNALEKTGTVKNIEQEILSSDPPIRGFVDVILKISNKDIVGEIKTIKDEYFVQRQQEGQPSKSHLLQILIYMTVLDADEGFVLYESKNTNELLSIPVLMTDRNKEYIDYVFDWMRQVYSAWEEEKQIKRGYTKSNWVCKNCPVSATCDEIQNVGEKIDNLVVGVE